MSRQVLTLPDVPGALLTQDEGDQRYEPIDSAYTKAESDGLYPKKTDPDPYPQYLTQGRADTRYLQISNAYTEAQADTRFLKLTGGALTGNLGVRTALPALAAAENVVHVGPGAALKGPPGGFAAILVNNSYWNGTNEVAIGNAGAAKLVMDNGNTALATAPSVAAGATQAFTTRFSVGLSGYTQILAATGTGGCLRIERDEPAGYLTYQTFYRQGGNKWSFGLGPAERFGLFNADAGAIRMEVNQEGNVGVGAVPSVWRNDLRGIQVAGGGGLFGQNATADIYLANNTYIMQTPSQYTSLYNAAAGELRMSGGSLNFKNAPAVAPGTAQAFTDRFSISVNGGVYISPIQPTVNGLGLQITRGWSTAALCFLGHQTDGAALIGWFDNGNNSRMVWQSGIFGGGVGDLVIAPYGAVCRPVDDNTRYCGSSSYRWAAVYSAGGVITTSHVSDKEDLAPLDGGACVQAVLDTDWISFSFRAPVSEEIDPDPDPEEIPEQFRVSAQERVNRNTQRREASRRVIAEGAPARRQRGYVLGSPAHRVSDLFGLSDRKSASLGSDLAVVACALQQALQRINVLETHILALEAR